MNDYTSSTALTHHVGASGLRRSRSSRLSAVALLKSFHWPSWTLECVTWLFRARFRPFAHEEHHHQSFLESCEQHVPEICASVGCAHAVTPGDILYIGSWVNSIATRTKHTNTGTGQYLLRTNSRSRDTAKMSHQQSQQPPQGPPYPPQGALPGGAPTVTEDVPTMSVFLVIYLAFGITNLALFNINWRKSEYTHE